MKNRRQVPGRNRRKILPAVFVAVLALVMIGLFLLSRIIGSGNRTESSADAETASAATEEHADTGMPAHTETINAGSGMSENAETDNAGTGTSANAEADNAGSGTSADADAGNAGSGTSANAEADNAGTGMPAALAEAPGDRGDAADTIDASGSSGTASGSARDSFSGNTYDHASDSEGTGTENRKPTELEEGREYLSSLEDRSPEDIASMIERARETWEREQQLAAYRQKREEYRQTLAEDALWEAFEDYAFLGDSRVSGFSAYGFLPQERILAEPGDTILAISDHLEEIRALSPEYIFISYGINDVNIGYWSSAEEYAEDFGTRLAALREAVPGAEIYVNSILPASEEAVAERPSWGELPVYSEAVREICRQMNISFIDNDNLAEEHADLYEGDGVHVQPAFYRYWAENQLLGIYDHEHRAEIPDFTETP